MDFDLNTVVITKMSPHMDVRRIWKVSMVCECMCLCRHKILICFDIVDKYPQFEPENGWLEDEISFWDGPFSPHGQVLSYLESFRFFKRCENSACRVNVVVLSR